MYVHPEYQKRTGREPPLPAEPAAPPEPTGEVVAAFDRPGRGGPDQQLRVTLEEFKGHPFLSIRLWTRDREGGWWPVRGRGVSVRLSEAEGVAEALQVALDLGIARACERGA